MCFGGVFSECVCTGGVGRGVKSSAPVCVCGGGGVCYLLCGGGKGVSFVA